MRVIQNTTSFIHDTNIISRKGEKVNNKQKGSESVSIVEILNDSLEQRLKKNKLSKSWVAQQMHKKGESLSPWQIYNAGIPGRMEESRAEGILKKCLQAVEDYETRMGI